VALLLLLLLLSYPTQSANSMVFGTVAESRMTFTCAGSMMITSSHTTPRSRSLM